VADAERKLSNVCLYGKVVRDVQFSSTLPPYVQYVYC
jgi:hypothetical protein